MPLKKISNNIVDEKCNVCLFANIRNEIIRLPFFLEYYRNLGISQFFIIDNGSSDDSQEYLLQQPDVHLFFTAEKFIDQEPGVIQHYAGGWIDELMNKYANNKWCLYVDADEFLVYPESESISIQSLCHYLDQCQYQGLFSIMLDMYSDKKISQIIHRTGDSLFKDYPFYDNASSYFVSEIPRFFPHVKVEGGPFKRVIWSEENPFIIGTAPLRTKIPLIKYHSDFKYHSSTHLCTPLYLADISSVLAHFKITNHFIEHLKKDMVEQRRYQFNYKPYHFLLEKDVSFYDKEISLKFEQSSNLVENKLIVSSQKYQDFVQGKTNIKKQRKLDDIKLDTFSSLFRNRKSFSIDYTTLLSRLEFIKPGINLDFIFNCNKFINPLFVFYKKVKFARWTFPVIAKVGWFFVDIFNHVKYKLIYPNWLIDFMKPELPEVLLNISGLSGYEKNAGRWSDSKTVVFDFVIPLPKSFSVELMAYAFGPNANETFKLQVGKNIQTFILSNEPQKISLSLKTDGKLNRLSIEIPAPISPNSLGDNSDCRELGMRFMKMSIIAQ